MSLNIENVDLIIQYSLLAAGDEDDYLDCQLGPIHIIKYVYLADLFYAKFNNGQTFTGVDWSFYKFGPWSQEVNIRIEPALQAIHANRMNFPSDFEDKDDWVRWEKQDDHLLIEKQKKLPSKITIYLKQLIHKFGKDTSSLLDYVYKTKPMLNAAPNEKLNFDLEIIDKTQEKLDPSNVNERELTKKQEKKFNQGMNALREKFQKNKESKLHLINPAPYARYDDIYKKGVEWLDSLAGDHFIPTELEAEFSPEVWKSSSRRDSEIS